MSNRKIVVLGLTWLTRFFHLREYFQKFGEIEASWTEFTGRVSLGFGFVVFKRIESALKAIKRKYHYIDNQKVNVEMVGKRKSIVEYSSISRRIFKESCGKFCKKIYVGNLSKNIKDDEVRTYFSKFGQIDTIFIPKHKDTQYSRSFGYVTFVDRIACQEVLKKKNHWIKGKHVVIEIAKSFRKRKLDRYTEKVYDSEERYHRHRYETDSDDGYHTHRRRRTRTRRRRGSEEDSEERDRTHRHRRRRDKQRKAERERERERERKKTDNVHARTGNERQ